MRFLSILLVSLSLLACGKPAPNTLTVGTIAGPETDLVETARDVALKRYGLTIKIVEFSDYNLPNEALQDGSLDANVYQHMPYLQSTIDAHHYDLVAIGKTFVYPTGVYSKKYTQLQQLPDKAIIAIPNDPSNELRALKLLQKANLITLKPDTKSTTLSAIASNPKQLQIKELDAAQLPRVLSDVDAAVINTNYAIPAGLDPLRDALFMEDKHSPYANLIVIRRDNPKQKQLVEFVKSMNSPEIKEKAQTLFGSAAIPAWEE